MESFVDTMKHLKSQKLGESLMARGFTRQLESYGTKADPADQQKCAELLAQLQFQQQQQEHQARLLRPKTAMADLGMPDIKHVTRPYETTYAKEYIRRPDPGIRAIRPMTSDGFTHPETVSQRPLASVYGEDFTFKDQRPASPIRTGTASGLRSNKPHPPKPFLMWKFPRKTAERDGSSHWTDEMTREKLTQVTKRMFRTTYQNDYLGIPQGFQMNSAFGYLSPDWRDHLPYSMKSLQRASYRFPTQEPELILPGGRFGSRKLLAAVGAIPTANPRTLDVLTRTTYDRHYNETGPDVALQARDVNRGLEADLNRYKNEKPFIPEKRDSVARLVDDFDKEVACVYTAPHTPTRPAAPTPRRARLHVPDATPLSNFDPGRDTMQFRVDYAHTPMSSPHSVPCSPTNVLG